MIETGLNKREIGKLILGACFVTDLGTVLALGVMFAHYDGWLAVFLGASAIIMPFAPKFTEGFLRRSDGQVGEPEIKLLLLMLFVLGGLAAKAGSEAVLPAYILGLVVAGAFTRHRETIRHLRIASFALLTPFYFLKAGALVHLGAVTAGLGTIALLLAVKVAAKFLGVLPMTRVFRMDRKTGAYTTLLMSTGLTFGTISAMFGLSRGLITPFEYSALVTTVIASAVVPTLIAQRHFRPRPPHHRRSGGRRSARPGGTARRRRTASPIAGKRGQAPFSLVYHLRNRRFEEKGPGPFFLAPLSEGGWLCQEHLASPQEASSTTSLIAPTLGAGSWRPQGITEFSKRYSRRQETA